MYGVEINDKYAYFLSQHTSIFLGGIAAISWLLRDIEPGVSAKKLVQGLVVTNMLGAIITLYAAFTGIFVGFGWSDPAFFLSLSILSVLQVRRQGASSYKTKPIKKEQMHSSSVPFSQSTVVNPARSAYLLCST